MSDQGCDFIGHWQILGGHCLMTDCYLQPCTLSSASIYNQGNLSQDHQQSDEWYSMDMLTSSKEIVKNNFKFLGQRKWNALR